jgi:putative ABC transport system permease protein
MSGAVPVARRNLTRQRLRLALSVSGIGLALLMILALDGVYTSVLERVTAYPDNQGAPLIASETGVATMHMSSSTIPKRSVNRLIADPRVDRAAPILYTTVLLGEKEQAASYLIGYRESGGPWKMAEGRADPRGAEIVLDERTADRLGVGVGSTIAALGMDLRIVGLADGGASVVSGLAFVDYQAFAEAAHTRGAASYVLIWPREGPRDDVAAALAEDHGLTVQTRAEFSDKERQVISDMSTGLVRGMLVIGIVVGLAVAALSMYTATLARQGEYAVLKAIGMRNRALYALVSRQSLLTVAGGLLLALGLVEAMAVLVPLASPSVDLVIGGGAVLRAAGAAVVIGLVAAFIPARRVARLDPASVYRR